MRRTLSICTAAAIAACAPSDDQSGAAEATLSPADVAGQWTVEFMPEGSDSVVITVQVNATSTTEGWTVTLPGRDPIPQHVVLGGDSIVMHGGPFESTLRPGVMVTTEGAFRMVDGALEGWTVAHYATQQPDSVVRLRSKGTRVQN